MRAARLLLLTAALATASFAAGCESAAERARREAKERAGEQGIGGGVPWRSDTMTLGGEGGTVTAAMGSPVPSDFPKAIPLYPGAKTTTVAKADNPQGKPAWSLTLESGDGKDQVLAYYKANLAGFTMANEIALGDQSMSIWQSPQYDVTLMVSTTSSHTSAITLSIAQK